MGSKVNKVSLEAVAEIDGKPPGSRISVAPATAEALVSRGLAKVLPEAPASKTPATLGDAGDTDGSEATGDAIAANQGGGAETSGDLLGSAD